MAASDNESTAPELSTGIVLGAFLMVIPASRRLKCWKVLLYVSQLKSVPDL